MQPFRRTAPCGGGVVSVNLSHAFNVTPHGQPFQDMRFSVSTIASGTRAEERAQTQEKMADPK